MPIDRDPDVIWGVTKSKLFRACRISTGKADDKVVPDLIVLGHSGMTIREYEACVKKYWKPSIADYRALGRQVVASGLPCLPASRTLRADGVGG